MTPEILAFVYRHTQNAAGGHICRLCTYYSSYTIILTLRHTFTVTLPLAPREPAHCHYKVGRPCCNCLVLSSYFDTH